MDKKKTIKPVDDPYDLKQDKNKREQQPPFIFVDDLYDIENVKPYIEKG